MAAMEHHRRPKVYRNRVHPLEYFDDFDFISRYRLPKDVVRHLCEQFGNSMYISTHDDPRGKGVSAEDRVSAMLACVIFWYIVPIYGYLYG